MIETYRSIVHAWECDSVDHFTTGYYFAAFGSAEWILLQRLGLDAGRIAALEPRSCRTRFMHELRAGSAYHILSGVLDAGPNGVGGTARLGHHLVNSETGELCATHLQDYSGTVAEEPIEWPDEKPIEAIDFDSLGQWSPTAANVVRPRDLDHSGRMSLSTLIHVGSDANVQFQNRIGMTSSYMHQNLIGFATMAYRIELGSLPREPGAIVEFESALAHIGRSSLRIAHRVLDGRTRAPVATLAQYGVHFDRQSRRPADIPSHIRKVAEKLARR
jgi:acyl-CoA thioesterase FadM